MAKSYFARPSELTGAMEPEVVTVAAGGACGSSGRPPRVCSARVIGSDELWQTKKNLVLCSRIAESSFHFDPV